MNKLLHWYYVLITFRDHARRLNRCADVENKLWSVASGKRGPLSPDECREMALKLGVPDGYRIRSEQREYWILPERLDVSPRKPHYPDGWIKVREIP